MNRRAIFHFTERTVHTLHRIEDAVLAALLVLMISMAVLQILLRNFFDTGILWGDALVRILVLWIALAGAMVAGRENNHISIDVITRYLPHEIRLAAGAVTSLFTAVICSIVAWYSFQFLLIEIQDGIMAFARIPVWVCESIIPFSFCILGLRYGILTIANIMKLFEVLS